MNRRRLRKLIATLEKVPEEQFNLNVFRERNHCGTVGCAIGWCPEAFPKLVKAEMLNCFLRSEEKIVFPNGTNFLGAVDFFGLEGAVAESIFMPHGWSADPTKRKVINRLKRLVENRQNKEDLADIRFLTRFP